MRKGKYKKKKVEYLQGYDHYDKKKTIPVTFFLSEAERSALEDLTSVLGVRNLSAFVRGQAFKAYNSLTPEQKAKMREVAEWRHAFDNEIAPTEPSALRQAH